MFQKIKNIFKKTLKIEDTIVTKLPEPSRELIENKKDNIKQSKTKNNTESVIKKTKRAVKYRK